MARPFRVLAQRVGLQRVGSTESTAPDHEGSETDGRRPRSRWGSVLSRQFGAGAQQPGRFGTSAHPKALEPEEAARGLYAKAAHFEEQHLDRRVGVGMGTHALSLWRTVFRSEQRRRRRRGGKNDTRRSFTTSRR